MQLFIQRSSTWAAMWNAALRLSKVSQGAGKKYIYIFCLELILFPHFCPSHPASPLTGFASEQPSSQSQAAPSTSPWACHTMETSPLDIWAREARSWTARGDIDRTTNTSVPLLASREWGQASQGIVQFRHVQAIPARSRCFQSHSRLS